MSPPRRQQDDLLDKHEAAAHLGISVNTLRTHRYHPERGTFPEPDRRVGNTDCWLRSTLDAWRAEHPTNLEATS